MKKVMVMSVLIAAGCVGSGTSLKHEEVVKEDEYAKPAADYLVTAFNENGDEINSWNAKRWRTNDRWIRLYRHDGSMVQIHGCTFIIEEIQPSNQ